MPTAANWDYKPRDKQPKPDRPLETVYIFVTYGEYAAVHAAVGYWEGEDFITTLTGKKKQKLGYKPLTFAEAKKKKVEHLQEKLKELQLDIKEAKKLQPDDVSVSYGGYWR